MSDSTRRVSVRLSLDGGQQVEGDLRRVGDAGEREMQRLVRGAENASRALQLLGPVISGLSVTGVALLVRNAVDAVGGLGELADAAGVSTDALQALGFAATQAGVSNEELQRGLQALTRRISDAAVGEQQAQEAFNRLGIAFRDASGNARTTEAVFFELAERIAALESPAERAALATALFGDRIGQRLVPLLAQGRDGLAELIDRAIRFGAVADADLIAKADEASDRIAALERALTSLGRNLLALAAGPLATAAAAFEEFLLGISGRRAGQVQRSLSDLRAELQDITDQIDGPAPARGQGLSRLQLDQLSARAAALRAQIREMESQQDAAAARQERVNRILNPEPRGGAGEAEERRRRAAADIAQLQQQLDARVRIEAQFQQQLARIREAEQAGAVDAAEAQRLVAQATEQRDEALRRLTQTQRGATAATRENRDAERELAEILRERERLIRDNETAYERYQRRLENLGRVVVGAAGAGRPLPEETIRREAQAALEELQRAEERTREISDTARELGLAFSSAFEDAIVRGRRFSDVLRGLEQDLLRLGTRRLLTEPLLSLFDGLLGGRGSGGDIFSRLLGGIGGGGGGGLFSGIGSLFTSIFGSIFHEGGMVGGPAGARAVPALAFAGAQRFHAGGFPGLRPNEVPAILQRGERVLSREEVRRSGGGNQVNVTIVAPSPETFSASRSLIEARMARAVRMGTRNL